MLLVGGVTGGSLAAQQTPGATSSGPAVEIRSDRPGEVPTSSSQPEPSQVWLAQSPSDRPTPGRRSGAARPEHKPPRPAARPSELLSKLPGVSAEQAREALSGFRMPALPSGVGTTLSQGRTSQSAGGGSSQSHDDTTPTPVPSDRPTRSVSPTPTPSAAATPRDLDAPETSASTLASEAGAWTISVDADETATFECSIDGGPFEACGSSVTFQGLRNGWHTFAARATDSAGNTDPSPVELRTRITGRKGNG